MEYKKLKQHEKDILYCFLQGWSIQRISEELRYPKPYLYRFSRETKERLNIPKFAKRPMTKKGLLAKEYEEPLRKLLRDF